MSEQQKNGANAEEKNWILQMMDQGSSGSSQIHEKIFKSDEKLKTFDNLLNQMKDAESKTDYVTILKNARLSDVEEMTKSAQEDLSTVIGAILESTDTMGDVFDDLRKYDPTEQGLKDEGARLVQEAQEALTKAENWDDWKEIFGWKARAIKARTQTLKEAQTQQAEIDQKVKMLFNSRLRNAGLEEQLDNFRVMTAKAVGILNTMADESLVKYNELEARHKIAETLVQKSSVEKARLYEEVNKLKINLDTETKNLVNFVNGTPDYDTQQTKIAAAQKLYDETNSRFAQIQAAHDSKEKFLVIIKANMTADSEVAKNLRSLAVTLNSGNEERQYTYSNTIHLIKTANLQETGSAIEKIGAKEDLKNLEITSKITAASEDDAMKRLQRHPKDMKDVLDIFVALSQLQSQHKRDLDSYVNSIKKGYMVDMSGGGSSSSGGTNSAPVSSNGGTTADLVDSIIKN